MAFPPIDKSMTGLLQDMMTRLTLVERRLATSGGSGSSFVLPDRLGGPAGDIPTLPSGTDLNAVTATGWYIQRLSADATLALNYPVNRAGHLEVSGGLMGTGADLFMQTYTEYLNPTAGVASRQWRRTNYNGTWQAWAELPSATAGPFPAPIRYATGTTHTVAATAWGTTLPGTAQQSMTVGRDLWVLLTFGAWAIASAGETRFGVVLGGATTVDPPNQNQGGIIGSGVWGQTGYLQFNDVGATGFSAQRSIQRVLKLSAGTTTFDIQAYLVTAGTHSVNYPVLEVVPLYWDGVAPPLPVTQQPRIATGTAIISTGSIASGTGTDIPVTFPVGLFTAPPDGLFAIGGNGRVTISHTTSTLTKDGVTFRADNWSTGTLPANNIIRWTAIQTT
jgi:hypothetical protein